jgi:hypothetical protein
LNVNAVTKHSSSFIKVADTGVYTEPASSESSSNNCANFEHRAGCGRPEQVSDVM